MAFSYLRDLFMIKEKGVAAIWEIPGEPIPPILTALFTVYLTTFVWTAITISPYNVVQNHVKVITKPATVEDEDESNSLESNGQAGAKTEKQPLLGADGQQLEELDVEETVVLETKVRRLFSTLLSGSPSPGSLFWSLVSLMINLTLMAMVLDYCFRASVLHPAQDLVFTRLGHVSHDSAKVLVREPREAQFPLFLSYRFADPPRSHHPSQFDGAWNHVATVNSLTDESDFTAALTVTGLKSDTRYQYAFSNNQSGFFITAPRPGHFSGRLALQDSFTFVHTSCIIPHFPYNPLHHPLHIPGLPHLAKWLKALKPAFMLFLGDFIYIDVPMRHGSDVETYRKPYRHVYASPDWPSVATTSLEQDVSDYDDFNLPWLHVYDDHEIENDWTKNATGVFPAAFDPYNHYHVAANPPLHGVYPSDKIVDPLPLDAVTYFSFVHGPAAFFLMDCRRFRTTPNRVDSTMLGDAQLAAVLNWLREPAPPGVRWKFIISSVPFTKNWRVNGEDTWAGYLDERRQLLEAMWEAQARDDGATHVILSGDRHEFAATAFPPPPEAAASWPRDRCTVHEFSCSPLDMFYLPVRTYRADVDSTGRSVPDARDGLEDVRVHYEPDGNHKFGAVRMRRTKDGDGSGNSHQDILEYRLFVDGKEAWSHVLVAAPQGSGGRDDPLWS